MNQIYHIATARQEPTSHLLDFCPLRSIKYHLTPQSQVESALTTVSVNTVTTNQTSTHETPNECADTLVVQDINSDDSMPVEASLSLVSNVPSSDSVGHSTGGDSQNSVDGRDVPSTVRELSAAAPSFVIGDSQDSVDGPDVPSTVRELSAAAPPFVIVDSQNI